MKTLKMLLFFAIAVALAPFVAAAQESAATVNPPMGYVGAAPTTIGELMGKGGVKLSPKELAGIISGATVTQVVPSDKEWTSHRTFKDDGTLSGYNTGGTRGTETGGVIGKWSVNDKGLCLETVRVRNFSSNKFCNFYWQLGDPYYFSGASATDGDMSANIFPSTVQKKK